MSYDARVSMSTTPPDGTIDVPAHQPPPAPPAHTTAETTTSDTTTSDTTTVTDTVKDVAATAKDAAQDVTGIAKDEAVNVAGEARDQAQHLLHRTRDEVSDQVSSQQERLAGSLRTIGDELSAMSEGGRRQGLQTLTDDQERRAASGVASELSGQLAEFATRSADWLEGRQPADVLEELRGFARRKPGTFLAVAGVAGLLAGRLTRGAASSSGAAGAPSGGPRSSVPPSDVAADVSGAGAARHRVPGTDIPTEGSTSGVYGYRDAADDEPAPHVANGVSQPERTTLDDELFGRPTEYRT